MSVSVIIPVYNAEKYLDRCVQSVSDQSYKNLEIILIDDGSTDNSSQICDSYADNDKRIHVIHQKNSGVSCARNVGIECSSGEYVMFVDADDWLDNNYIEKMVIGIKNSDVSISNFKSIHAENGLRKREYKYIGDNREIDSRAFLLDCFSGAIYTYTCWGKLYKRSLINDSRFENLAFSEDALFCRSVLAKADKIVLLDFEGYNYYQTSDSVTQDNNRVVERLCDEIIMLERTIDISKSLHLPNGFDKNIRTSKKILARAIINHKVVQPEMCEQILNDSFGSKADDYDLMDKFWFFIAYAKLKFLALGR